MTTQEPPPEGEPARPRGSHRAERESSSLLLPLLGVLAVLAALGLAGYMLLTSNSNGGSDGATPPTPTGSAPTASTTGSPKPSASASDSGTTKSTQKPTKQPTGGPSQKPTKKPTKKPTAAPVPQIPVYVFNQTGITGLAAQTAGQLTAAGWNVAGYSNWRGYVPEDTVYYYPGDRAAARRLSHDFPDIQRVWPASAPMRAGALTVILADTVRK